MSKEHPQEERMEDVLRNTLQRESQPELSPFFAARVANIAKAEQADRNRTRRRLHPVLAMYWGVLLVASIWFVGNALRPDLAYYLLLALVPAGFALAVFWRRMLVQAQGLAGWLLGR